MYFWNIKSLNKDLEKGLTQKEDFKYLLVNTVLGSSILFPPISLTFYEVINSIVTIILTIGMVIILYNVNGGEKGNNFLSRYFAIGFVTFIRSVVYFLIPLMIVYIITLWLVYGENIPEELTVYAIIFTIISYSGFIYLARKYFLDLKNNLKNT